MFAKIAFAAILVTTPCIAQEGIPDTLALSDEDAQTCKVKACRTITEGAYELISLKVQQAEDRAARAEAKARRLEAALEKKPKYCI